MNTGKTLFAQLMDFLPWTTFTRLVDQHGGDRYAKSFACTEQFREGIYSSQLATWRKQRATAERAALAPQKRGRKADPGLAEARRFDQLTRENDRLRHQFAQARTIIDGQKKVCTLPEWLTDEPLDGTS